MNVFSLQSCGARKQRGMAMPVVVAAIIILALIAVAAWYLIFRPSQKAAVVPVQAPVAAASVVVPAPANVESMSVSQLLEEAGKAMREQRLLAPAGNNAFEFYLKVLAKDPVNQSARDALRETFPFAANAAEQEINAGNFDEAQREIEVLTQADSGNYTLTILRSKLDAQRKLASREEEQQKQDLLVQQNAAAAASATAQQQALAQQQAQAEAAAAAERQRQAAAAKPKVETAPAPAPTVDAPPPQESVMVAARLIKTGKLRYPTQALRRRQEGWVDVRFTVDTSGKVVDASVVSTDSGRVFERAAISAVEDREYAPATRDGVPVSATLTQRIQFKL